MAPSVPSGSDQPKSPPSRRSSTVSPASAPSRRESVVSVSQQSVASSRPSSSASRRPLPPLPTGGPRRTSHSETPGSSVSALPAIDTSIGSSATLSSVGSAPSTIVSGTQSPAPTLISGNATSRPSTSASGPTSGDVLPPYEYRSPEAVVEHFDEPSDSNLPPGVLAEHLGEDDNIPQSEWDTNWSFGNVPPITRSDSKMDIDASDNVAPAVPDMPQRPQIGPGVLPKLWLDQIHPHKLWRPLIDDLPRPRDPKSPSRQSSLKHPVEPVTPTTGGEPEIPPVTLDQVFASLPGGRADSQNWYFCPDCWGWIHVLVGKGELPTVTSFEEWDQNTTFTTPEEQEAARTHRLETMKRFQDMELSRSTTDKSVHHLHAFEDLMPATKEQRLERVNVPSKIDAFSFHDPSYGESPPALTRYVHDANRDAVLYVSCSSDIWVFVDKGPVSGQIPVGLVKGFTAEKKDNPNVGSSGDDSVVTAWNLLLTLLQNPLFRNQRGWFKLDSKTFSHQIGASLLSSHLLYRLGFVCKEDKDGYLVGPLNTSEASTDDVHHMNNYLARAWVEISLGLLAYRMKAAAAGWTPTESKLYVRGQTLGENMDALLHLTRIPEQHPPYPNDSETFLHVLGASKYDTPSTIEDAYDLQISEDYANCPIYLSALTCLSHVLVPGHEVLQIKVATEKSLDRYTTDDLDHAYEKIGLGRAEVEAIAVPREEIPIDYILSQHREAMNKVFDSTSRSDLGRALLLIGKERNNEQLMELGRAGEAFISLDDAYKEFGLSRDSNIDDELLILQYETWIQDRPSRSDHYRRAISVIATAPGEERPALRAYLEGKDISEFQPPARLDIPVGLRNIGNTCYLNSVLQLLYALKPVREAVMAFADDGSSPDSSSPSESENAAERKVKLQTSKHFVTLLRELFEDMYKTANASVTPREELARLAILPIDLVAERKESILIPEKTRVTIDSLPTIMSPCSSPGSSGAATANDTAPSTPVLAESPRSTTTPLRSERQASILGKRASEDRDSVFGSSEERPRRPTGMPDNLIDLQDSGPPTPTRSQSVPAYGRDREDSELTAPAADLSQLDLASPLTRPQGMPDDTSSSPPKETETAVAPAPPSAPPPLPPRKKSMALVAAEKFGLQQDAAEILINVLAQLEYALDKPTEGASKGTNLIKELFSSKFQQQMLLHSADGTPDKTHPPVESVFVHPIIGVEEDGKDLYDCLSELYLGGAEIEYDGKKGFKMDLLEKLPPVLYIQMRRSQYDPVKGRQVKINTHVPFGRALDMDRFLATGDPAKRERSIALTRAMMKMRTRRHELKNHKPMSIPDAFRFVRDALATEQTANALSEQPEDGDIALASDEDITPDLLDALAKEGEDADAEIASLEAALPRAKEELEAIWTGNNSVEYELVSVFIHGGTGTGGHYWTYQADLPNDGNKFFYYSDDTVKEVPSDDVFSDKSAQGVSPALLCYVRKDRDLVDTLHREPTPEDEQTAPASASSS